MDLSLLSNDISFDILGRLPANMLVQQRFVSKGWQRLISDPDFVQIQMTRAQPTSLSGYFFQERFEYSNVDVETLSYISIGLQQAKIYQDILAFLPEKVMIVASSNGLICCRSCTPSSNPSIYICNPVNKQSITLKWDRRCTREYIAFAFEPSSASAINPVTGCTLLRVSEVDDFTPGKEDFYFAFETYDFKREMWVKSKETCHCEDSLCNNKQVLTKGVLYWMTDGLQILMFVAENELSLLIQLPMPFSDGKWPEICLGETDGKLHCIMVFEGAVQAWALVDCFSSQWDIKSFIPLELMEKENPEFLFNLVERVATSCSDKDPWMRPLAYKDGFLFLKISYSAYSFHFDTMKLQLLCKMLDLGPNSYLNPKVLPYSMTLASFPTA